MPLPPRRERLQLALLALLVLAAGGAFLLNGWVQDDAPRILYDARVREWSGLWSGFAQSYWPPPSKSGLFRPLAMTLFTLEWKLGGGAIALFRLGSLLWYGAAVVAVWKVARRYLSETAAFIAATAFAVHPLHTEVLATAVDQAESAVVVFLALGLLVWADVTEGKRDVRRGTTMVIGCYLAALAFKENALIFPALLVAADLLLRRVDDLRAYARRRGAALAAIGAAGIGWWGYRAAILGSATGAAAAEGLRDTGFGARLVLMLGVIPEWGRLFLWPAALHADYAPRQIDPDLGWGTPQLLGCAILLLYVLLLAWSWRRERVLAFALAWIGIALFPVSNVIVPTGVILAERTLFLASVGVVLALGAAVDRLRPRWEGSRELRRGGLAIGGVLLLLAVVRDVTRAPDWRDAATFVQSQLRDSPKSWRAHTAAGIWAFEAGDRRRGEYELRTAIAIWPNHARPYHILADYYRGDALCVPAIPLYEAGLAREPDRPRQRLSATACLLWLGRYQDAAATARAGAPTDVDADRLAAAAKTADSAAAVHAPQNTVRLPASKDHAGEIGWRRP